MDTQHGLAAALIAVIVILVIIARARGAPGAGAGPAPPTENDFVPQPLPHPQSGGLPRGEVDANRLGVPVPDGDIATGREYSRARAVGWGRRHVYGAKQGYGDRWGMREYSLGAPGEVGADVGPLGSGYSLDHVHGGAGAGTAPEVFGVAETLKYVPQNANRRPRLRDTDEFNTAHIDLAEHLTTSGDAYALYETDVDHYDPESQGPRLPRRYLGTDRAQAAPVAPMLREPDHDPLVGASVVNQYDPLTLGEPMHSDRTRGSLLPAHA